MWQNELELSDPATTSDREEFEKNANAVVEARHFLHRINYFERTMLPETVTSQLNTSISQETSSSIELHKFSVNPDEWHEFCQTFCSLIHVNERISVVHKHNYLRQCLVGPATQTARSIPLTDTDYKTTTQVLRDGYVQPERTVKLHVAALFELEAIKIKNAAALNKLYTSVCDYLRVTTANGELVQHWDPILIHLISSKPRCCCEKSVGNAYINGKQST